MPQETALVGELTVKETIFFFGRIFQMEETKISERCQMLLSLLELPRADQRVKECSGGQKRRVSFAAAMIHEPDLLILDEPTVGLDPILREKIWNFMVDVTRSSKMSIIVTTHYIDEARQADCCGLMMNGVLLAEDTPRNIISRHGVENLEEAFLRLCTNLVVSKEAIEEEPIEMTGISLNSPIESITTDETPRTLTKRKYFQWATIRALILKNILQIKRQPA
jgi:ABC-type multidrug transport system ATPase subunit